MTRYQLHDIIQHEYLVNHKMMNHESRKLIRMRHPIWEWHSILAVCQFCGSYPYLMVPWCPNIECLQDHTHMTIKSLLVLDHKLQPHLLILGHVLHPCLQVLLLAHDGKLSELNSTSIQVESDKVISRTTHPPTPSPQLLRHFQTN